MLTKPHYYRRPRPPNSPLRQSKDLFFHSSTSPGTDNATCSQSSSRIYIVVGMSQAHGHATAPGQSAQAPEMGISLGEQKIVQRSEQETIASKGVGLQRHRNKQNLDYVLKSGLAGGLAGCAVRFPAGSTVIHRTYLLIIFTGQNGRRSSRSCQNPLPSFEPPVRKIYRLLVRRCYRHERHQPTRRHARSIPWSLSNTSSHLSLRWYKILGL